MNTRDLAAAYQHLFDAAQAISDTSPLDPDQRADVDWTLCHVALSDRILTHAAREVRSSPAQATAELVVDNQPAMDPAAIAAMTASTTHRDRIAAVRQNAASLISELDQTSEQAAQAPLTLRFHDKTGQHVGDTNMTWTDLIELRAHQHISAHATRLASYLPTGPHLTNDDSQQHDQRTDQRHDTPSTRGPRRCTRPRRHHGQADAGAAKSGSSVVSGGPLSSGFAGMGRGCWGLARRVRLEEGSSRGAGGEAGHVWPADP